MSSNPVCRPEGTIEDSRIVLIKSRIIPKHLVISRYTHSPMQLLCNSKPHADKLCEHLTAWFPFYTRTGMLPSTFLFANDCVSLSSIFHVLYGRQARARNQLFIYLCRNIYHMPYCEMPTAPEAYGARLLSRSMCPASSIPFNSLGPRPDRRHFADAIFKCIFLNKNV